MIRSTEKKGNKAVLAMAFHAFQPVFNFESQTEKAFDLAYRPLLETLKEFPAIKGTFHFSGNVLEWLVDKRPGYVNILKEMVDADRVEILGGGFYEPVIPAIPRADALGQLKLMNTLLLEVFGREPRGVWTTERVWHRTVADILNEAKVVYTILDDNHILSSYGSRANLFRPCLTYGDTSKLVVFPASTKLRYMIPFSPVRDIMDQMRRHLPVREVSMPCFFFADDMEKFGAWPHTYAHVYKRKWLERFFEELTSQKDWIETATYSEIFDTGARKDVGVIPPSSYSEMEEWSEGGFLNFMRKYPESGRMHRRMLGVSSDIGQLKSCDPPVASLKDIIGAAEKEVFKAQTSCPYWHGTFGGVYLPHLREGIYRHVIRAQNILEQNLGQGSSGVYCVQGKANGDVPENIMGNKDIRVYVESGKGACIDEIDIKEKEINLLNVFSRRPEKYHKKLEKSYASVIKKTRIAAIKGDVEDIDIHDILGVRHGGLRRFLSYDEYERKGLITKIVPRHIKWGEFANGRTDVSKGFMLGEYDPELSASGDLLTQTFFRQGNIGIGRHKDDEIAVSKSLTLGSAGSFSTSHKIVSLSPRDIEISLGIEFNFLIWDSAVMRGAKVFRARTFGFKDRYSGLRIDFLADRPLKVLTYPVYSVNETECGLDKTFQGVCVVMGEHFDLSPGEKDRSIDLTVCVS